MQIKILHKIFPPSKSVFISILLFCSTGIISATRIHLYLALLCHRDYFDRPNSSPACFFPPQGLFPLAGFISILLFCSTGITLPQSDSSLSCFSVPQGLFRPTGFISIWLFCAAGIISTDRIHPTAEMHLCRAIQQPEIYCSSILPIFSAITRVPTAITKTPISIT